MSNLLRLVLLSSILLIISNAIARDYQRLEVAPIRSYGNNDSYATSNSRPDVFKDYRNQQRANESSDDSETHYKGTTSNSKEINANGLIINKD